jgi:hypothetical protein
MDNKNHFFEGLLIVVAACLIVFLLRSRPNDHAPSCAEIADSMPIAGSCP